jgi:cephalosporin hydroxylase
MNVIYQHKTWKAGLKTLRANMIILLAIASCVGLYAIGRCLASDMNLQNLRKFYYKHHTWPTYLGIGMLQYPDDCWIYQKIITEVKPDVIVETGTGNGGTTLYLADVLERINSNGIIITVDLALPNPRVKAFRNSNRITFLQGDSVSDAIVNKIGAMVGGKRTLVTLDSRHDKSHVLKELSFYSKFVSRGSYIIVQDTHLSGHPNDHPSAKPGDGPWEAVMEFMRNNKNFIIDKAKEKNFLTQNPNGFLKRIY